MTDEGLLEKIGDILEATDGIDINDQAQAIIDELGLKMQGRGIRAGAHGVSSLQHRVVGRWEKTE